MKKITKRIMALMLSLVMVFGCIPSFTNIANAATLISEVNLISSGVLARNIKTKKYKAEDGAHYTLTDDGKWYKDEGCTTEYNFSTDEGDAYRQVTLTPEDGYEFAQTVNYQFNGIWWTGGQSNKQDNGTLIITIADSIIANAVSLDFPEPSTYSDLIALDADFKDDKSEFYFADDAYGLEFTIVPITESPFDGDELGVFALCFKFIFTDGTEPNSIENVHFNNIGGEALNIPTYKSNDIMDLLEKCNNNGLAYYYDISNTDWIVLCYKVDLSKTATITCPTAIGTAVSEIKQSIVDTLETTASTDTSSIAEDLELNKKIQLFDITNGIENAIDLDDTDVLEDNKAYVVEIDIKDVEAPAYSSIKVNDTTLTYTEDDSDEQHNNHYRIDEDDNSLIYAFYKIDLRHSSGSKKYKADDNDTAEKISGTGKKGSQRTIIPEEGREVEEVIVKDKDGNEIEVTKNEDGTYSFKQPASNVTVDVRYKKRVIKLTIGSLEASVDGIESNLDVCPIIRNDRTMLPIRFVAENLGAKVDWDEKDPNTVIITRGDTKIVITLGSDKAYVNGEEYILDSVAFAENDRTYLPVRFVSEKLNAIVEWNEAHPMDVKIYER